MDAPRGIGTFVVWDYVVFAAMLLISAAIGIYYAFAGGGQQTSKDFLMGGRSMTAVPVALSLTASFMSAVTVLGTPSEVYRFGAIFSIFAITYFFVVAISAEVFLPVFYKLGITSTYEYLELRFNKYVRLCGTVLFIVLTILYTGIVIYAPALALNQVTGFDLWGAVVATGVVCTFYCTLGGLKAVVWTDVFQVGIMVAGFASVIIQAVVIQGGISTILNDAYNGGRLNFWNFNPNPLQRHTFWTIVIGGTFTWTSIYGVNQSQVQRYISCKSRFQAKMSLYINLLGLWAILTCSVLCGLALYSRYHDCDPWTAKKVSAPDQLMPYLVLDILQDYPGLPGLFVACAYSGTLSTVSSSINALAAVTVEDLVKPHFRSLSERSLSWISQGLSVMFGALCIGMAALASLMGALLQSAGVYLSLGCFPQELSSRSQFKCHFFLKAFSDSMLEFMLLFFLRTPLMDNWYSLSYLYLSTLGTLVTLFMGMLISLPTGGRKQNLDRRFLLTKEDFLSNFDIFKKKKHTLSYKSHPIEDGGTDNPAFNHIELNFTDQSGKINGTRL
uniref:sodium-coupled monocarboxylate transporter 1 n=1 Tax=Panthera onca TaxID=9690 RepID=UPI0029545994|nr:sodium-coupled monocarboxylate transporter 1 [Panthera onca]